MDMNNETISSLEPSSHSNTLDVDEVIPQNFALKSLVDNSEFTISDITDEDELGYTKAIEELMLVHDRYLALTNVQKLWVLKNKPHMLFLQGTPECLIRKSCRKGITELERHLAMSLAAPFLFNGIKSVKVIQ